MLLIVLAVAVWGSVSVASADTSIVKSEPNGDLEVTVSAGCGRTNKDRDGNFNTCTKGDNVSLFFSVFNLSSDTQTVRIDYELDGPGVDVDQAFTQEVVLEPDDSHQEREEVKVKGNTPTGDYTLTVTASGSETATTSASVTVH